MFPSLSQSRRQAWVGLAFISPWLIGLVLFKLLPILGSLGISFTDFYALEPQNAHFNGLTNYLHILRDIDAGAAIFGTLSLALLTLPVQLLAALAIATLLNSKRLAGKGLLRALFFLPSIIPGTAIFIIAFGFLDPQTGWLNRLILEPLGLPPSLGVYGESGFNFLLVLLTLWAIGPSFLIMLGAMQGIPPELYEAARVDGAGPVYRFIMITVPSISPAIFFSLIIGLVSIFGGAALLDQGAPFGGGISAYDNYIGAVIFRDFTYGYAAALAWAFFVLMLGVVLLLFRTARYWVHYADGEHSL